MKIQTSPDMLKAISMNLTAYTTENLKTLLEYYQQRQDQEKIKLLQNEFIKRENEKP